MPARRPRLPFAVRRELARLLDEASEAVGEDDLELARARVAEAAALAPEDPDVLVFEADLALGDGALEVARERLERVLEVAPESADAHHLLSLVLEDEGDREGMIAHRLRVLALDARVDRRRGLADPDTLAFIEGVVRRVLAGLPAELAERVGEVPIVLEARPSFSLVREGFDPRALGLFEGPTELGLRTRALDVRPTRIVIFYANLLAMTMDDEMLAEQVEITVLHELGHFFGLDEDDVDALGLG